ncbi:L-arabinose isomerase [Zobellia galactanivorans]|uniref:L-arabinose isomerase n=1 Tax=Zobellia galactanivorans (strain DSM 12802 / CCUG 47099 / CIP 106680 / NCIMB 13871 / Dsij) TaxID=63186 RepID=UPI001C07002E|nr:L-arabinose isomerase [Zobellia galactanivorans]MBU3026479.1 L-arabinose isomerase [Zobellia galactanivorans]
MIDLSKNEVWFVTGSQHLYGPETLAQVAEHSRDIAKYYDADKAIPVKVVFKPVVKTPGEISALCKEANNTDACVGLVMWMHTFSPAKMWIAGLQALQKPFLHLHTQYNRDIPWNAIDMDFMNLNQSAHGGREFGFLASRMRLNRKVVVGHWQNEGVLQKVANWCRVVSAVADSKKMKVARFGDNMRQVAVTEGNKVSAQMKFGYEVNGYGVGDLVKYIDGVSEREIDTLIQEYRDTYTMAAQIQSDGSMHSSLRDAARIELGMRAFLGEGGYTAFTDTFEDLHGMKQLPGIATQRLMASGYGFGGEGDWKTAALVRTMKVMGAGLEGGNSFMEDYTYHFDPKNTTVLGSHMLEICPSIAKGDISCEIHPLGIGGKEDPVRLVFNAGVGRALNASIVDMGNRFRMLVNSVEAVEIKNDMPKLPVARVLWEAKPDLQTAAAAWIYGGGAHHTCYSQNVSAESLEDFAEIMDIEFLLIDEKTDLYRFKQELRWNDAAYGVKGI